MTDVSGTATPAPLRVVGGTALPTADWETVYRDHVAALYRYAYARTGNRPDAEDVTSTAFMRALPRLRPDVSEGEMRSYLRATARTVIADMWQERHGVFPEVFDEESMSGPRAAEPAGEVDIDYVLADLPANYRQVLELRFLRGYTVKETAAAMHISVGNAKVLQLRALRRAAGQGGQRVQS
jgi:RNA polymerase sigma factor (sigma-70 family)